MTVGGTRQLWMCLCLTIFSCHKRLNSNDVLSLPISCSPFHKLLSEDRGGVCVGGEVKLSNTWPTFAELEAFGSICLAELTRLGTRLPVRLGSWFQSLVQPVLSPLWHDLKILERQAASCVPVFPYHNVGRGKWCFSNGIQCACSYSECLWWR